MISAQELQESLKHFTSTDNYYRHLLGIRYTDGVQYLAFPTEAPSSLLGVWDEWRVS